METAESWQPVIVCFICSNASYSPADLAIQQHAENRAAFRFVRVECGRMDPLFVLRAFQKGADGVVVAGCAPGECGGSSGDYAANRRHFVMQKLLNFLGLEAERFQIIRQSHHQSDSIAEFLPRMADQLHSLGPNVKFREVM